MPCYDAPMNEKQIASPERVSQLAEAGLSQAEIADRLGITRQGVQQIVKRNGISCVSKRGNQQRAVARSARVDRFRRECEGMTAEEAAQHIGVSVVTVGNYAKETGTVLAAGGDKRLSLSRITEMVVKAAPEFAAEGLTKTQGARKLGISPKHFTAIVHRRNDLRSLPWRDGRRKAAPVANTA